MHCITLSISIDAAEVVLTGLEIVSRNGFTVYAATMVIVSLVLGAIMEAGQEQKRRSVSRRGPMLTVSLFSGQVARTMP